MVEPNSSALELDRLQQVKIVADAEHVFRLYSLLFDELLGGSVVGTD